MRDPFAALIRGAGEFADTATVADVVEVECNPFVYGTGAEVTVTASQLYSRCHEVSWYVPNEGGAFREARGPSIHLHLDRGTATPTSR